MDKSATRRALAQYSSEFIQELEQKTPELRELIIKVEENSSDESTVRRKTTTGMIAGQATLGAAGVIGIVAAPFTGGLSLALAGLAAATGVAGGATSIGVHLSDISKREKIEKTFRKIRNEFSMITESLRAKLDNIVTSVINLRDEYCAGKQQHLIDCETRIKTSAVYTFSGEVQLAEVKGHFTKIVEELRQIQSLLQQLPKKLDA